MSSEIAIKVDNLSKCYQIYDAPQDRLKQMLVGKLLRNTKPYYREFWALKDVSFEVKKGQTVGIIGRNGSGKSTLLQMICGTLNPTSGSVQTHGRIAALLELGAGFNPEFSGRENVYLNAEMLGLTIPEIDARFDDILAFADIGQFITQPVKTYSSGMFVRLAFAIAIHVDPNVLIVDEALSVGDIGFQNKCLIKIRELRSKGTTLLFVTHDIGTLQLICNHVIWLENGSVQSIGDAVAVSQEYQAAALGKDTTSAIPLLHASINQKETGIAKFIETGHEGHTGNASPVFNVGDIIRFKFKIKANTPMGKTVCSISIFRADGDWVIGQTSLEAGVFWPARNQSDVLSGLLVLQPNCLAPGDYMVALGAHSEDLSICYALTELALPFSVRWNYPTWGKFIHPCEWIVLEKQTIPTH